MKILKKRVMTLMMKNIKTKDNIKYVENNLIRTIFVSELLLENCKSPQKIKKAKFWANARETKSKKSHQRN